MSFLPFTRLFVLQTLCVGEWWIDMEKREEELVVGGYRFATVADAETARMELKKIENLQQHLDYRNPQNVLMIYNRAIENRIFLTPVGQNYLQRVQEDLLRFEIPEEKIRPIPLYGTYSNKTENSLSIRRSIAARKPKIEYRGRFITSVWINILLLAAVVAMIVIAVCSETPNMINYRSEILSEYSQWEQELTEREQAVREAEKSLQNGD